MSYIKMEDLKEGYLYKIRARNASYGIWREKTGNFIISRHKFGMNYLFEEYHYDMPDFATARPIEEIGDSLFSEEDMKIIPGKGYSADKNILKYLNGFDTK